ncbi:MAG: pirin family protein [Methanomassiliicoccales archaeon]
MRRRSVRMVLVAKSITEGAGVRLNRAFGQKEAADFDPFLLLDHFRSFDPNDFEAGFPFHPHRGIQTVTYLISGSIEHQDSLGNWGKIGPGEVQWMIAGSGILHQEMPRAGREGINGFQLWVNLPRDQKLVNPSYQDFRSADIPTIWTEEGARIKIIAGSRNGVQGAMKEMVVKIGLFHTELPPRAEWSASIPHDDLAFAHIFEGGINVLEDDHSKAIQNNSTILFTQGDCIMAQAGEKGCQFLFAHGTPLKEPMAWRGPIVMNTQKELDLAFEELRQGNFVKIKSGFV